MTNACMEAERIIGYTFARPEYLEDALTHSSYHEEKHTCRQDNERLEFLGDAILDTVVSEALFHRMQDVAEGKLTKMRARIVCEQSLASVARELKLGAFIRLGKGEDSAGGREKDSILADAMEAVIAAVFLDGGYEAVREFVLRIMAGTIEKASAGQLFSDYKSQLQERLQQKGRRVVISYTVDREEGPPHDRTFYVHAACNGQILGRGCGKSKKEAEQRAACMALRRGEGDVL